MTYKFDFVKKRKIYFLISGILILIAIGSLVIQGLNLGIDFVSGTRLDLQFTKQVDLEKARDALKDLGYEQPNVRLGGDQNNIVIFRLDRKIEKKEVDQISQKLTEMFQNKPTVQEQTVDPIVGKEIAKNAFDALLIASVGIVIYIAFRFEYRFAIAAILTLAHDAFLTVGLFSVLQLEVDLTFVAAILTIVGYSINDTIVIFDRIRENMDRSQPKTWDELVQLVNASISQTLVRSINTVLTVLFGAVALMFLGGESIRNFSLALFFGLIFGAYSSIFLASQIWIGFKWKAMQKEKEDRSREPVVAE